MLRHGASLQDVVLLLRHRSIETTPIYIKVDILALRKIVQPWPEVKTMLTQSVESYLAIRRAAGFAFESAGSLLKSFAAFSEARGECYVRSPIAIQWAGASSALGGFGNYNRPTSELYFGPP